MEAKHRNPFICMKIDKSDFLNDINGRSLCVKCSKSRKFFCYSCYVPTVDIASSIPKLKLPIKIDIIKHTRELDGKSTAIHAAILAPDDVSIYAYPNIPDYNIDSSETVLIFPTHDSISVSGLFDEHCHLQDLSELNLPKGYDKSTFLKFQLNEIDSNETIRKHSMYSNDKLPIKRAIFIDSTWQQSKCIFRDVRVNKLRTIILQNRLSQFWRHQNGCPRWFLATIEAIHQFLLEFHISAWGLNKSYEAMKPLEIETKFLKHSQIKSCDSKSIGPTDPYNGQYDNLLFFFVYIYQLIHRYYDENTDKAERRPIY